MDQFVTRVRNAVDEAKVAGAAVVGIYKTKEGTFERYERSFGKESLQPYARDMSIDSLIWVFSCTKLLTSVAALQLVERGLLTLDDPLSEWLPEYKPPIPVASLGADGATLSMTSTDAPITLRHLLTHTSGISYDDPNFPDPGSVTLTAWRASLPDSDPRKTVNFANPRKHHIEPQHHVPLLFPPGAEGRWAYGPSLDWAGKVIERSNGEGLSLGGYMAKHIWGPLGMRSTTFRPLSTPGFGFGGRETVNITERVPGTTDQAKVGDMKEYDHVEPVDEVGGIGMYSTPADYAKVLESLLRDDGKILSSETAAELFRPQLPDHPGYQAILSMVGDSMAMTTDTPVKSAGDLKWNHGLGGALAMDPIPGKFAAGVMVWSGLCNSYWWIDRKGGTAGFYGSQMLPFNDRVTLGLYSAFQKAVADLAAEQSA